MKYKMVRPQRKNNPDQYEIVSMYQSPKEIFREIRNYLAGQFIGSTRDEILLDELLKCLFCKLYIEMGYTEEADFSHDSSALAEYVRSVFSNVRKDYSDIYTPDTEILLNPHAISHIFDLCSFSLFTSESDPVGDAFEVFVGSESRSRSGQFFTPRSAVDLLVEVINPQPDETVIDPACGAGGFLAGVLRHHLAAGISRHTLPNVASNLHGIDKDDYLAKLAKLHVSLLSGGEPRITCGDSLALRDNNGDIRNRLEPQGYDVLLTNPPFGSRIVSADSKVLETFALARKWRLDAHSDRWIQSPEMRSQVPPQVLFVERCLSLLRDGGRLGIVVPESLVSNKTHRYVVQYLMDRSHVTTVIGMPEALFKTSGKGGTHTKTCLIVAEKDEKRERGDTTVFMAEAKWCGHDSRAKQIPFNDLPAIGENIKTYRDCGAADNSTLGFLIKESDIADYILCPHYYDPHIANDLDKLSSSHDLVSFGDLVNKKVVTISTGDELGKLAYGTGDIPFIRTSDMSNWEIKADAKHGVSREIYDSFKKKQDVRPYDILMVRDGTYLIGTCAIVTPSECNILYQSHIYKIRVNENEFGLTPFLLIAILSSPVVQRQIKAKQFTQDIIDTLGDRIHELVLPIPRDSSKRAEIGNLVEQSVNYRIRAREVANEARELAGAPNGSNFSLRNGSVAS